MFDKHLFFTVLLWHCVGSMLYALWMISILKKDEGSSKKKEIENILDNLRTFLNFSDRTINVFFAIVAFLTGFFTVGYIRYPTKRLLKYLKLKLSE